MKRHDWRIFFNAVFFVLGFSVIFSIAGITLQTALAGVSASAQWWLSKIGGVLIALFGFYLMGLVPIPFLDKEHKIKVKKCRWQYLTSFVFGAAFALAWSPCIGAILGAVLTLALTNPSIAFLLMLSYSLGLGIPFLIVGLFATEADRYISKASKWVGYSKYVFGILLILLGVLVFLNQMSIIASFAHMDKILPGFEPDISSTGVSIAVAFFGGIASFLSPCVFPLIPAFLTYLASLVVKK